MRILILIILRSTYATTLPQRNLAQSINLKNDELEQRSFFRRVVCLRKRMDRRQDSRPVRSAPGVFEMGNVRHHVRGNANFFYSPFKQFTYHLIQIGDCLSISVGSSS